MQVYVSAPGPLDTSRRNLIWDETRIGPNKLQDVSQNYLATVTSHNLIREEQDSSHQHQYWPVQIVQPVRWRSLHIIYKCHCVLFENMWVLMSEMFENVWFVEPQCMTFVGRYWNWMLFSQVGRHIPTCSWLSYRETSNKIFQFSIPDCFCFEPPSYPCCTTEHGTDWQNNWLHSWNSRIKKFSKPTFSN